MVETITPVVYGGRRGWIGGFVLHVAGATLAAAVFGAVVGLAGGALGAPFGRAGLVLLAAVALVYAVGAAGNLDVPVPQLRRQVPDWWRTFFSPPVTAFLYGAGLGIGFLTFLATGALVVVTLAAALSGSAIAGAAIVGAFGLARGLSAVSGWRVRTPADGGRLVERLSLRSDVPRRVAVVAALSLVGLAAAAAATGAVAERDGRLAAAIVAVAFGWAAIAKLTGSRRWRRALGTYALPAPLERAAVRGVPVAETTVAVLVVVGAPRVAAALALGMLIVFAVATVRAARRRGGTVACGCFGGRRERSARSMLARDAVLAALAVVAFARTTDAIAWPGAPGPGEVLPAILAVTGVAVALGAARVATLAMGRGRA